MNICCHEAVWLGVISWHMWVRVIKHSLWIAFVWLFH